MFNSYVNVYRRVNLHFPSFSYGFPIKTSIFLWFLTFTGGYSELARTSSNHHPFMSQVLGAVRESEVGHNSPRFHCWVLGVW